MHPETLLICGARALALSPTAEAWARARIVEAIRALPAGSRVLFGNAAGPDTWASDAAKAAGLKWQRFYPSGDVIDHDGTHAFWMFSAFAPRPRTPEQWRQRLLARDRAMAAALGSMLGQRRALGLLAPWPNADGRRTHGTDYTLRCCRAAGVEVVTALTCPAELGPAGA